MAPETGDAGSAQAAQDATTWYLVGVDVGGTFTDCVIVDSGGRVASGKVLTRKDDRSRSFFEAVEEAAAGFGLSLSELFARAQGVAHGTTTGTNALLTRTGGRVGLLTTSGHRDMTHFMKGSGRLAGTPPERVLDLPNTDKPDPLVPKRLIREVVERIDFEGEVIVPLDEHSVREALRELVTQGVDAIAVSLLWAPLNDVHERRVVEIVREEAPELFVCSAAELSPRVGEFERTMTGIINAYIGGLMTRYVGELDRGAAENGFTGQLLYTQCAGGAITGAEVVRAPIRTVHSGPVSGTLGSAFLAERMGESNVIVTDMGGTSFDVSIVRDGGPEVREVAEVERFEVAMPMVFLDTIGAGGGSIAWIDDAGGLQVGPQSAGAEPGPACYGRGGTAPTVTDADVVLGVIDPDNFLHGRMRLDRDAAVAAIQPIADHLGLSVPAAAAGISRIIDAKMADLLRRMSVLRGLDPTDFVCFAYGGGGPVHAGAYARDVGVKSLVVPMMAVAPLWSAFGAAISDVRHVYQRWENHPMPADPGEVTRVFEDLEAQAGATLTSEGFGPERQVLERYARMKYNAQLYDVEVPMPHGPLRDEHLAAALEDFARIYDELHGEGAGYREGGARITAFAVRARGLTDTPPLTGRAARASAQAPVRTSRPVYWAEKGDFLDTPVIRMSAPVVTEELSGPMLIELPDTVAVLRPGQFAHIDELGSLVITL
ncbi:MAG TPA: hydantoinase/oxoprolinase family protein [Pseudonocardia sp.]|jgi:N-methylhydantoinase A|nr:hydantoinase/oxoprolinase family protein [Pseudonocardia sp.]